MSNGMTPAELSLLCRWTGVLETDTAAVAVLEVCYARAVAWYQDADCNLNAPGIEAWVMDLAAWFYDHRGADDAQLPQYIVVSVHQFRGGAN